MVKAIELLMIEDNPSDIRLSQEYLKGYNVPNHLSVVQDDVEALRFLRGQGVYALAALPDIILISIRIIWMNDKRRLMQIKNYAALKHIPVVIMTGSEDEEASLDDDLAFGPYLTKPLNLDCLFTVVKDGRDFSLTNGRTISAPKPNEPNPSPDWNNLTTLQNWHHESGTL